MQDNLKRVKVLRSFGKIVVLMAVIFLSGCGESTEEKGVEEFVLSDESQTEDGTSEEPDGEGVSGGSVQDKEAPEETTVFVYVCGAVKSPGVYELTADSRVFDAISSAGGITEEAAPDAVNQARVITDGEQIYVPTAEEAALQGSGVGEYSVTEGTENAKVNINTAGEEELMTLTGIGEAKAASILQYREEHGRFESIEELMQIEGIKEGVFNKIKDDITI